jgi:hypothetical protein
MRLRNRNKLRRLRKKARRRRASVEAAIAEYYDHLSEPERREQEAWGRFAMEQLRWEN